eukprot:TRINITY_DN2506_c0_g3_i3.p1 TRINITY_DN2506_c0_g3~~TRINITY_DN2506_c0_g3_i3.p1  ORF type:complete len:1667 (+),score=230.85 TRINITY_DN2506_c0_g3_i3:33-5003(+)
MTEPRPLQAPICLQCGQTGHFSWRCPEGHTCPSCSISGTPCKKSLEGMRKVQILVEGDLVSKSGAPDHRRGAGGTAVLTSDGSGPASVKEVDKEEDQKRVRDHEHERHGRGGVQESDARFGEGEGMPSAQLNEECAQDGDEGLVESSRRNREGARSHDIGEETVGSREGSSGQSFSPAIGRKDEGGSQLDGALVLDSSLKQRVSDAVLADVSRQEGGEGPYGKGADNLVALNVRKGSAASPETLYETLSYLKRAGHRPYDFHYVVVIQELVNLKLPDVAQAVLDEMRADGIPLRSVCLNAVLNGWCVAERMDEALRVLELMKSAGCPPITSTYNTLIKGLGLAGRPEDAAVLLSAMLDQQAKSKLVDSSAVSVEGSSAKMDSLSDNKEVTLHGGVVNDLQTLGVQSPNSITRPTANATGGVQSPPPLVRVHLGSAGSPDLAPVNSSSRQANSLLEVPRDRAPIRPIHLCLAEQEDPLRMPKDSIKASVGSFSLQAPSGSKDSPTPPRIAPNLRTLNTLLNAWAEQGNLYEARKVFRQMRQLQLTPDVISYNTLIKAYGRAGQSQLAEAVIGEMENNYVRPNVRTFGMVIKNYCQAGDMDAAWDVTKSMQARGIAPNLHVFNTLISGFSRKSQPLNAEKVLDKMEAVGVSPNVVSFTTLMNAWAELVRPNEALRVLERMLASGVAPDTEALTVLAKAFSRASQGEEAERALARFHQFRIRPNVVTFTTIASCYCNNGRMDDAVRLVRQMVSEGLRPSPLTYATLVRGCRPEYPEDALKVLSLLESLGVPLDDNLYGLALDSWQFMMGQSTAGRAVENRLEMLRVSSRRGPGNDLGGEASLITNGRLTLGGRLSGSARIETAAPQESLANVRVTPLQDGVDAGRLVPKPASVSASNGAAVRHAPVQSGNGEVVAKGRIDTDGAVSSDRVARSLPVSGQRATSFASAGSSPGGENKLENPQTFSLSEGVRQNHSELAVESTTAVGSRSDRTSLSAGARSPSVQSNARLLVATGGRTSNRSTSRTRPAFAAEGVKRAGHVAPSATVALAASDAIAGDRVEQRTDSAAALSVAGRKQASESKSEVPRTLPHLVEAVSAGGKAEWERIDEGSAGSAEPRGDKGEATEETCAAVHSVGKGLTDGTTERENVELEDEGGADAAGERGEVTGSIKEDVRPIRRRGKRGGKKKGRRKQKDIGEVDGGPDDANAFLGSGAEDESSVDTGTEMNDVDALEVKDDAASSTSLVALRARTSRDVKKREGSAVGFSRSSGGNEKEGLVQSGEEKLGVLVGRGDTGWKRAGRVVPNGKRSGVVSRETTTLRREVKFLTKGMAGEKSQSSSQRESGPQEASQRQTANGYHRTHRVRLEDLVEAQLTQHRGEVDMTSELALEGLPWEEETRNPIMNGRKSRGHGRGERSRSPWLRGRGTEGKEGARLLVQKGLPNGRSNSSSSTLQSIAHVDDKLRSAGVELHPSSRSTATSESSSNTSNLSARSRTMRPVAASPPSFSACHCQSHLSTAFSSALSTAFSSSSPKGSPTSYPLLSLSPASPGEASIFVSALLLNRYNRVHTRPCPESDTRLVLPCWPPSFWQGGGEFARSPGLSARLRLGTIGVAKPLSFRMGISSRYSKVSTRLQVRDMLVGRATFAQLRFAHSRSSVLLCSI